MTVLRTLFAPPVHRLRQWLHLSPAEDGHAPAEHRREPSTRLGIDPTPGPGHAPGHRHLGPPPPAPRPPRDAHVPPQHHPAWLGTGGRVDRQRRSERRGDERE